ncbi:phosphoribosylglycinamide formyltransferase [Luteimonas sp. RD2P54]|uniref:Phosphoribosylglycinamide formyltransferase n=1 Tax=Luteimonas endophytica TaxID=3042023 RepID=A0ABT6JB19_9GAMM|nr:phosphoribosylglycinamide formyltransferase [Luteimonas endophytica]MDH5824009.1 phosphoribosylglycinamide formyltransferase [Luteimonas endophytica]
MSAPSPPAPATRPYRIAVLASGRGSNLQALIDAIAAGTLRATLSGVFSDRADAGALERARAAGIPALALAPRAFASRADFDRELFARIDAAAPDLVVCAGYMRLLDAAPVEARAGALVNIHPSLLPAFKGLHTHRRALEAGAREHGASVHFVTADLDGGPVIAQARVPVLAGDDATALGARVLAREHPLLVETVRLLAAGRIALHERRVHLDGGELAAPLQLPANNRFA